MAKTKVETKDKADGNPPKNLNKVTKAKKTDVTARMVIQTLNRLDDSVKEVDRGNGHSLAKIRNYIMKNYGLSMPKTRQELIKEILKAEFDNGNIEMTNWDGQLNYTKRFQSTIDDDEIEDENSALKQNAEE